VKVIKQALRAPVTADAWAHLLACHVLGYIRLVYKDILNG